MKRLIRHIVNWAFGINDTPKSPAQLKWRKCKAGYKFPSEAIVIPIGVPDDTDPRLVKTAIYDSKYILVSDLIKLEEEI